MSRSLGVLGIAALSLTLGACSNDMPSQPSSFNAGRINGSISTASPLQRVARVVTAAGDIRQGVADFRLALGDLNANAPGSLPGGRREINWDAVPAQFTNVDNFPADFFNQPAVGRARGTVFSTPGTGFRTSDNNFTDLNPDFAHEFVFFSPIRTFAAVGSSDMTVAFFVPGSSDAATTTGFGVVFSDVDHNGSASIRLFDAEGKSHGRYAAPTSPSGLSFVGVSFPTAVVARVEIESGKGAVAAGAIDISDQEGEEEARDLVIMDDFIYGEPQPLVAGDQAAANSGASFVVARAR